MSTHQCTVGRLYFCKVPGGYMTSHEPSGVTKVLANANSYRTQQEAHDALKAAVDLMHPKTWGSCWTFGCDVEAIYKVRTR
jgi:hypothetical protein